MNYPDHLRENWYFHPPLAMPPWGEGHNAYTDGYLFMDPAYQAYYNPTSSYLAWEIQQPGGRRVPTWGIQPVQTIQRPPQISQGQPLTPGQKSAVLFHGIVFVVCAILATKVHPLWIAVPFLCIAVDIMRTKHPVAYHTMNVALAADNIRRMHKENVRVCPRSC